MPLSNGQSEHVKVYDATALSSYKGVNTLKILLFEDNSDDEELAVRVLKRLELPLDVVVARNGRDALLALGFEGPTGDPIPEIPHLVISDLKMPLIHGDKVLERTRGDSRLAGVPFVLFSTSPALVDVDRCMALGASDFVVKPTEFEAYRECLQRIVKRWLG